MYTQSNVEEIKYKVINHYTSSTGKNKNAWSEENFKQIELVKGHITERRECVTLFERAMSRHIHTFNFMRTECIK